MTKNRSSSAAAATATNTGIRLAAMTLLWGPPLSPKRDEFTRWLREVKDLGYDGIASFADPTFKDYFGKVDEFRRLLEDHGLDLASVDVRIDANFDLHRKAADFMAALGCRHMVCLGGTGKEKEDFEMVAAVLNRMGTIAAQRGVRASYHHHTNYTGESLKETERLLELTDPAKVAVMCDVGHATKDFVELPVAKRASGFMEKHWDRLDFVEFKDWSPETDLATPVGEGSCDYHAVFELLKRKKYAGWITVEQNGPSRGRTPTECARLSLDFIHRSWFVKST